MKTVIEQQRKMFRSGVHRVESRTRENLRYSKEHGIRLSEPRLGRPPKELDPEILKLEAQDSAEGNVIEGKFGQCKLRLGLGRVMAKLSAIF